MAEHLFAGPQQRGEHLRPQLELVHLRQAVLDYDPVLREACVELLLRVRQRMAPRVLCGRWQECDGPFLSEAFGSRVWRPS